MLHTAPSLSVYNSTDGFEGEEKESRAREKIVKMGSVEFSFGEMGMGLIEEKKEEDEEEEREIVGGFDKLGTEENGQPASPRMYLATGLGIEGGDGLEFKPSPPPVSIDGSSGDEEYYKRMVDEYPCHPLFLRNYAQLLQIKEDPQGAEQYYSRAILADPGDGEIVSQYAKLVWELHHDLDKASSYFERAVQASPGDCNVLAAHASFLWETGEDEEEPIAGEAQGDLQGAEEYFSHAILADPRDGEIMSQYAKFLWEQHHDRDKALFYFERAVEATPGDWYEYSPELPHVHINYISYERLGKAYGSNGWQDTSCLQDSDSNNVLAAHASFLWETEEDEQGPIAWKEHVQVPILRGEAVMT